MLRNVLTHVFFRSLFLDLFQSQHFPKRQSLRNMATIIHPCNHHPAASLLTMFLLLQALLPCILFCHTGNSLCRGLSDGQNSMGILRHPFLLQLSCCHLPVLHFPTCLQYNTLIRYFPIPSFLYQMSILMNRVSPFGSIHHSTPAATLFLRLFVLIQPVSFCA